MLVSHVPRPVAHLSFLTMRSNAGVGRTECRPEPIPVLGNPFPIRVASRGRFGRNAELASFLPGRRIQHPEGRALGENQLTAGRHLRDIVDHVIRIKLATPETQTVVRVQHCQRVQ